MENLILCGHEGRYNKDFTSADGNESFDGRYTSIFSEPRQNKSA